MALNGIAVTFTAPAGVPTSTPTAIFNGVGNTITVNSDATGAATVPAALVRASQRSSQYTVDVTAGGASTTILLINVAGPAATIAVSSGAGQSATISTTLPTAMVAAVVDGFGNPVPGVGVTFTAPASGATGTFSGLSTALTTTNSSGLATAPAFTLNATAGVFNVVANTTAAPLTPAANFNLVGLPGLPTQISISQGSPQSTQVTTNFGTLLRALVRDASNNPVPNVSVTFTAPAAGASATFAGGGATVTVQTNAAGLATATALTANSTTGSYNVTATFTGGPTINFAMTNTPGAATSISVQAGDNQSTTITLAFAVNLSVVVRDASGNAVPGTTVTFTAPGAGASGTFGAALTTTATTNASGIATASVFRANATAGSYTVTVTFAALSTSFTLTNVNPAAITATTGTPQSATITRSYATTMSATVTNAGGTGIAGLVVTFTAPGSGASGLFGASLTATATTNASGVATAPAFTANATAGGFAVTAAVVGVASPASFTLTNLNPGSIAASTGTPQSATITRPYATTMAATVLDAGGTGIAGLVVTFTAPGTGASGLFGASLTATATTNASGIATAPAFTANATAGAFVVTASVIGIATPASFNLTNLNPATITATAGTPQSTTVTRPFATAMTATVRDAGGTGLPGFVVTFTAPGAGASGLFGASLTATATTNASGVATAPAFTANAIAGGYVVTAAVTGIAAPANFNLTNVNPAAIAVQAGNGQQATINTNFPTRLTARVTNAGGIGIAGMVVTFTASGSGASGLFGASTTTTATTDANGDAQAAIITANGTAGAHTVNATVTGVAGPAAFSLTNLLANPVTIAASPAGGTPQSTGINTAFGTALGVIVRDVNNLVLANIPVTFTVNAVGGAGGTFAGGGSSTTVNTNAAGIATAPAFTANGTAGTYTVTATAGSLTFTFTLTNLAPAVITATAGSPQSVLINTNFGTQLQATVVDGVGTPVPGVTVTFTAPGSGATGTFAGAATTTAVTNASGVATASIIRANGTAGAYTVNATVAGVATAAAYSLTNTAPGSIAATTGTPQSAVISTNFAIQMQATVLDGSSNPLAGVTVTFTAPGAGATGTFAGAATTTAVTNAAGVATAAVIRANGTAGAYTVNATVAGVATPAAFNLTNTLAAPATATATAGSTPQSAVINTAFGTALGVLVRDAGGAVIVGLPVTFTVNGVTASATFAGGGTSTTVNTSAAGIATAPVLTANATAGSYTVTAAVGALVVTFNLSNTAAPASIAATAGDNQTATISTNYGTQLQATVRDAGGAAIAGAVVVFTAPGAGARATFAGSATATVTTNAAGIATAPTALAGTVAGGFAVSATVQGTAITTSFNLTNAPGAVSTIARVSGNAQTSALGANFGLPLVAVVRDGSSNPIPGVTVTFTAPAAGARATFPGVVATATATTDSTGQATSPILTATGATGGYNVSARATGGSNPAVNFALTNTVAVPGSVSASNGTPQTTVVNTNFGAVLQATVLNTLGSPVSGVTVTFTVPGSGASGTFSGATSVTATTNAAGVASSPTLRANTTSGTFFAQAAVAGVVSPGLYSLTNTPDSPVAMSIVSGTPQSTIVGTAFAAPLVAQVRDVYGNPVPGATVNFLAPTVGSVATFPGSTNTATVTTDVDRQSNLSGADRERDRGSLHRHRFDSRRCVRELQPDEYAGTGEHGRNRWLGPVDAGADRLRYRTAGHCARFTRTARSQCHRFIRGAVVRRERCTCPRPRRRPMPPASPASR